MKDNLQVDRKEIKKSNAEKYENSQWLKLGVELGPILAFVIAYFLSNFFVATFICMIATVIAFVVSYVMTRHIAVMPLVSGIMILIFGSVTLLLHDETFLMIKPTIFYSLAGVTLFLGLYFNKNFLQIMLEAKIKLQDKGWYILTLRWAIFFIFLAFSNEYIWRTYSKDIWVSSKFFFFIPATIIFTMFQVPLFQKYEVK